MSEAHRSETAAMKAEHAALPVTGEPAEPRRVMISVLIESKLGIGPSDHRSSRPAADEQPVFNKRARSRRHSHM